MNRPDNEKKIKALESNAVTSRRVLNAEEDILAYWTTDRMRSAVPVDLELSEKPDTEE